MRSHCRKYKALLRNNKIGYARHWLHLFVFILSLPAYAQPATNALNTGTNGNGGRLAVGSTDLNWTVALNSMTGTYGPAYTIPNPGSYYNSPWPDAQWISFSTTGYQNTSLEIYFKATIDLPDTNACGRNIVIANSFCLALDFLADNCVYEIYVNGVPQSGPNSFTPDPRTYGHYGFFYVNRASVNLCQNWISGGNEIIVHIKSGSPYGAFLCQASTSIAPLPAVPTVTIAAPDTLTCIKNSVELKTTTLSPGSTYVWSNGHQDSTNSVSSRGLYSVTITDRAGCTASASAVVHRDSTVIDARIAVPDTLTCLKPSILLTASTSAPGVLNYRWGTLITNVLEVDTPGIYTVVISNLVNCSASASVSVVENKEIPDVSILPPDTIACKNPAVVLRASSSIPVTYRWSANQNADSLAVTNPGLYRLTVTSASGCTASASVGVAANLQPPPLAIQVPDTFTCNTSVVTLQASSTGAATYSWSNGSVSDTASIANAGTYTLIVADTTNGCTATGSVAVAAKPIPVLSSTAGNPACNGSNGFIRLAVSNGTTPYTYLWTNGASSAQVTGLKAGVYAVRVVDAEGCIIDSLFNLTDAGSIQVQASGDTTISSGGEAFISATAFGTAPFTYQWQPGGNCAVCPSTTVSPPVTTTYYVQVTDSNGCKGVDTVTVTVISINHHLYLPNAFTPNGDGGNDYFEFYGDRTGINYIEILVFDRWGEKVFESNDLNFKWDGTYKGALLNPGVFVYLFKAQYVDGESADYKGSITLLR